MTPRIRKSILALAVIGLLLVLTLPTVSASIYSSQSPATDGNDQQDCTPRQVLYELLVYAYGFADAGSVHTVGDDGAPLCVTDVEAGAVTGPSSGGHTMYVTSGVLPAPPKF